MNPHVENASKTKRREKSNQVSTFIIIYSFIQDNYLNLRVTIINKVIKDHPEKIVKVSIKEKLAT